MLWALLCAGLAILIALPILRERLRRPMDETVRKDAPGDFAALTRGITHFRWFGPPEGPLVVCVHGRTTPAYVWAGLAEGLAAQGYRVLTYDLFGRGYSDRPAEAQTPEFHLRQLTELLDHLGLESDFVLMGHSMGGALATRFATAHPDRVRQLILITPAGAAPSVDAMTRFIMRTPVLGDWLMLAFYPRQHRAYTEAERALPSSVPGIIDRQQRELTFRGFLPAVLSTMRCGNDALLQREHEDLNALKLPVVAIWGEIDPVIPLSAKDQLARWNPEARQHVIAGGSHGLPYNDTDEIMTILRETL